MYSCIFVWRSVFVWRYVFVFFISPDYTYVGGEIREETKEIKRRGEEDKQKLKTQRQKDRQILRMFLYYRSCSIY